VRTESDAGCDISNCTATIHTISSGAIQPQTLVVDDANVFWSDVGSGGLSGAKVFVCPLSGCTSPTPLVTGLPGVGQIGQTSQALYWRANVTNAGALVTCAKTGCSGTPTQVGTSATISGQPLLIDSTNAYWSTSAGIVKCNDLSCLGGADVVAANQDAWALATDSTSLYWGDSIAGTIAVLTPK
jgi:hypothetical protein